MRKIGSFFLTLFICLIIVVCVVISLDLLDIIKVPDKYSIRRYLTKSIGTLGVGEEVFYPDYDAKGLNTENQNNIKSQIKEIQGEKIEETVLDQNAVDKVMNQREFFNENNNVTNTSNTVNPNDLVVDQSKEQDENINYNITDNSFFYTQLDSYGKILYSRLYASLDNLKTGTYVVNYGLTFNDLLHSSNGEEILTNAFQLSINALLLDHPEIFYIDVTKMYMFTESTTTFSGTTYKITIGPDENSSYLLEGSNSAEDVFVAENNLKNVLNSIISQLEGNDYNKVAAIHNFLIDSIEYDSTLENSEISHTLYGALINRLAVCDGYAKAFKYILDNIGISCVEVCGIAQNSSGSTESHAWNDVYVDGNWYAVDVTWDDPIIIGGNGKLTNDLRYNYFLKGSDEFYTTHQEDGFIVSNGEFYYPNINSKGY